MYYCLDWPKSVHPVVSSSSSCLFFVFFRFISALPLTIPIGLCMPWQPQPVLGRVVYLFLFWLVCPHEPQPGSKWNIGNRKLFMTTIHGKFGLIVIAASCSCTFLLFSFKIKAYFSHLIQFPIILSYNLNFGHHLALLAEGVRKKSKTFVYLIQ